ASFSVNSSSARSFQQERSRQNTCTPAGKSSFTRKGRAKRLIVGCARKLHDLSFAFPALVRTFRGLQRAGINVTPNHFYYPVPDLAELEQRSWPTYSTPPGCKFELRKHVKLAWELSDKYGQECCFPSSENPHCYHRNNGYFEAVDAEIAYGMVRQFKPSRIV